MLDTKSLWDLVAGPASEVSARETSDGLGYAAVLWANEVDGDVFASIDYHPDLDLPGMEEIRESLKRECWERVTSFADQGPDGGPYSWYPHSRGGYFCWLRFMHDPF